MKPTNRDRHQHQVFYHWVCGNFQTRYAMSSNFTGRHLGNFGFHFPLDSTVRLGYRNQSCHEWTTIDVVHEIHKAVRKKQLAPQNLSHVRKHRHSLALHLRLWKNILPHLIEGTGTGHDLRQIAQLTLILDYQIPSP